MLIGKAYPENPLIYLWGVSKENSLLIHAFTDETGQDTLNKKKIPLPIVNNE
jgi:hypothetical protein